MTIDIGWVVPTIGAFIVFLGFVGLLSILQIFWREFWGGHDE